MSQILCLAQKEMRSYFNSPVAYVVLIAFLLVIGYLTFATLFVTGFASLRTFFSLTPLLLFIFAPALTMKLIAEERKSGTMEALLTLPVSDTQVVLGKFVAASLTMSIGIAMTIPYAVSVYTLTPESLAMDIGPVIGGYLGLVLMSSTFISLGLFASSLTRNQIVAFIVGLLLCFFFLVIDKIAIFFPASWAFAFEFFSADYHFTNIARGVVDSRDLCFYASVTFVALMLTTFSFRRRELVMMLSFVCATCVALLFANLIGITQFVRIDLTRDGRYTLSAASIDTMQKLDDAMVITAYFTQGMPSPYASYALYVRDMLEEYRAASTDRVAFEFIDPREMQTLTSVESDMADLGIAPVEIRVIEDDQQQSKRAYMGLVIRYKGKKEVMPVVQDFSHFEKDLTTLMRKLVREKAPVVGIWSDVDEESIEKLKQLTGQGADLLELRDLKDVDRKVDALLIIGSGRSLVEDDMRALDNFVAKGKNVALFVDQYRFDTKSLRATPKKQQGVYLLRWLRKHGVELSDKVVADPRCQQILVQEERGGIKFGVPVSYPLFPNVIALEQNVQLSRGLSDIVLPFVSALTVKNGTVFARSSAKSWLEGIPINTEPGRDWKPEMQTQGQHALAAVLNQKSRILVVGTSAFVWDAYLTPPNQALALASVDYLLADDAMLQMHSRQFADVALDPLLSDLKRNVVKYANIVGVPALFALYGIIRWRRRERRRLKISLDNLG